MGLIREILILLYFIREDLKNLFNLYINIRIFKINDVTSIDHLFIKYSK